jgi:hypothetical protein
MTGTSDRRRAILVAGVALLLALSLFSPDVVVPNVGGSSEPERTPSEVKLVDVRENSSADLWPYTSRRHDYGSLTLPINVVVKANASRVWYALMYQTDARWNETTGEWAGIGPEDETAARNGSDVAWMNARGSTRYTYVYVPPGAESLRSGDPGGTTVGWMDATYQLHDGAYFGTRHHVRVYAGGSGSNSWSAIQAHTEHWDWFRLRHTVGSLARAQKYVEGQFRGEYFTEDISRKWYANGGIIDADGWVTVVDLEESTFYSSSIAALLLAFGLAGRWRDARRHLGEWLGRLGSDPRWRLSAGRVADLRRMLLFLAPVAITLFVRTGSIRVERAMPGLSPKLIAAGFYPVLAVGLPVSAYLLARKLSPQESFALALLGLGVGQIVDYTYLGVTLLPINVIVHRVLLVSALGFVAAGGSQRVADDTGWNDALAAGVAGWLFALGWPLLSGF